MHGLSTVVGQDPPNGSALVHYPVKSSSLGPPNALEHGVPTTQLAVVTPEVGEKLNLKISRIPVQAPKPGEVVVKIAWTGLCRSDACFSVGPEPGYPAFHHIAGHEGIGHVVQSHDPALLGRPVATRFLTETCRSCFHCLRGLPEACPSQKNYPKHHSGAFKQYVTAPWASLLPLPRWVFDGTAGLGPAAYTAALCSGSTALKALRAADPLPDDVVVVVGVAGSIGHLAGMMARHVFRAKVVGVDWAWKETAALADAGAFDVFVPAPGSDGGPLGSFRGRIEAACAELRGSACPARLADAVIVTAGSAAAFENLPAYVRVGGSITCVGVPRNGQVSVPVAELVERQLKIQGNLMGGAEEAYQVMEYIKQGLLKPLVTEIRLEDIPEYLQKLTDCKTIGKAVAKIGGESWEAPKCFCAA